MGAHLYVEVFSIVNTTGLCDPTLGVPKNVEPWILRVDISYMWIFDWVEGLLYTQRERISFKELVHMTVEVGKSKICRVGRLQTWRSSSSS